MSDPDLWKAARKNDVAGVRRCLAHGDEVDVRGEEYNTTPLMEAARHTDLTVLLLLLCGGADLEARDGGGWTALHEAAARGSARCARVLTSLGADINSVDHLLSDNPVMISAEYNHADTVQVLVEAGADLSLKDCNGRTALDLAEGKENKGVVSVITDPSILHWGRSQISDERFQTKLQSLPQGQQYRVLLLNNNDLSSLPDLTSYPQLSQLEVLNLSHNQLREVNDKHIPPSVRMIYVGHNNILSLSPQMESEWLSCFHQMFTNSHQTHYRKVNLQDNKILTKTLQWGHADLTDADLLKWIRKLDKNNQCSILLINNNNLRQLPTLRKYPQFSDLKVIGASHNQLTDVDDKHLPGTVKIVHLGNNNIQNVSSQLENDWLLGFCNSTNVKIAEVNLQHNPISSNTLQWGHADLTDADLLKRIEKLDENYQCSALLINNNKLTTLPDLNKHQQFADLKVIDASHNQLTDVDDKHLPDTVKIVHLGDNNIQNVSSQLENDWLLGFCNFIDVKRPEVNLQHNPISTHTLQWSHADLADADLLKRFGKLDKHYQCSILLINNNKLTQLPDFNKYPQFSNLKVIDASHNKLDQLPDLSQMREMKILFLTNNHIKHPNITNIQGSLENLNLDNNMIEDLPDMKKISNLKFISLSGNKLSLLPEFSDNMEHIALDNNSLQSVRNQAKMKKLTHFSLSGNKIVTIFGLSPKLQSIHVKDNPIHTLHKGCFPSEEVYKLLSEALTQEQIDCLQQPPPQIFRRGYEAVTEYYDQADISQFEDNSKNKLVIIGEASAGKTSLIHTLMSGVPCLTAEDERTQVVDTHTWRLDDNCSYQVFDQGGQDIYTVSNRLFISKESKNLICFNLHHGSTEIAAEMLKSTIQQFPTSEIHCVATQVDLIDSQDIRHDKMENFKYKMLSTLEKQITLLNAKSVPAPNAALIHSYENRKKNMQFFSVSSQLLQGISGLVSFLHELAKQNKQVVPQHWLKCFNLVCKAEDKFLTLDTFHKIYNSSQSILKRVFKPTSSMKDSTLCLRYYSDCGLVIWFEHHPTLRNFVFHKLQHLINVIKSVLHHDLEGHLHYNNNTSLQKEFNTLQYEKLMVNYKEQGLLSFKLLHYLWKKYELSTEKEGALLMLLQNFDICYEVINHKNSKDRTVFCPWFVSVKEEPDVIKASNDGNTITLHLVCIFNQAVPINITELMIVRLQRLAYQRNYLGERNAWKHGLYISDDTLHEYILRSEERNSLHIYVRGQPEDMIHMWEDFQILDDALKEILSNWHGILKNVYIPCSHCILKKNKEPQKRLQEDVICTQREKLYTSCSGESRVPAILVTRVNTDGDKVKEKEHIDAVKSYLTAIQNEKRPPGLPQHEEVVPRVQQGSTALHQETLQLQNQERQLDLLVQVRGTFLLRRLLQKQVLDTWGHELELLLQDTSSGVITKSGPGKDLIHKFQMLIYQNKQINLFDEEKLKLKGRNVTGFDITLLLKLLKVSKISGIEVTQGRWNELQKASVDDMLRPKKPGPPGRQDEEQSIHVRLAGWICAVIHFRNQIHNKTDHMNLSKGEIETRVNYLSQALTELMNYLGITEGEVSKQDDTELFYKDPYTEVVQHLTAAHKNLQLMSGVSDRSTAGTSQVSTRSRLIQGHLLQTTADIRKPIFSRNTITNMLQENKSEGWIENFSNMVNYKLTRADLQNIIMAMCYSCCLEYPINAGKSTGTGFFLGFLQHSSGKILSCIATNYHHLPLWTPGSTGHFVFDRYDDVSGNYTTIVVSLDQVIYSDKRLDYALFAVDNDQLLQRFRHKDRPLNNIFMPQSLNDLPEENVVLALIGHPEGKPMHVDSLQIVSKQQIVDDPKVDKAQSLAKFGVNKSTNLTCLEDEVYLYYYCTSFGGTSGSPCYRFAGGQAKLYAIHSGGMHTSTDKAQPGAVSDYEFGVYMCAVIRDIEKQRTTDFTWI